MSRASPDQQKKVGGLADLQTGPRSVTPQESVDTILGSRDELIHMLADFPKGMKLSEFRKMGEPVTDLELKTLCVLARAAIVPGEVDTILTACLQLSYRSNELGALSSMLCLRAGGLDIEHPGLCGVEALYPELLESALVDAIKLGPPRRLASLGFFWLTSVNSERAKELAPSLLAHPHCSGGLASMCQYAATIDPPLRLEVPVATLSLSQQETVKRIFPIACRAIFSADMEVATESIKKLGAEPVEIAAPLLVVAARMEGERSQAAAREELRRIAPAVAEVLPTEFTYSPPRTE